MAIGLIGIKRGMTCVYTDTGNLIPVTVIEITSNRITQVKNVETDGYAAIQVTAGSRKAKHISKPLAGHYAKANVAAGRGLWEFRLPKSGPAEQIELLAGAEIKVDMFANGDFVDIAGISKGKGFAGVIKRHNFSMQDATHGNSLSHRAPGSIGQRQTPGRVFKGKRMAGHMGSKRVSVQNLEVVRVDAQRNLLLVKGAVPGAKGGNLIVKPAVKKPKSKN